MYSLNVTKTSNGEREKRKVKMKSGNIDVCAENRKTTIRNSKLLLFAYEHTLAINLSKKVVDIAFFKVKREI